MTVCPFNAILALEFLAFVLRRALIGPVRSESQVITFQAVTEDPEIELDGKRVDNSFQCQILLADRANFMAIACE